MAYLRRSCFFAFHNCSSPEGRILVVRPPIVGSVGTMWETLMKRLLIRVAALATIVGLGCIAIAHAQRGGERVAERDVTFRRCGRCEAQTWEN